MKKRFKHKKDQKIFPLSYNPQLNHGDIEGLDIYYNYLQEAFKNNRIKNIAVTGAYGVGKSSIIRSFNKRQHCFFKKKREFLYVSLGEYYRTISAPTDTKSVATNGSTNSTNQEDSTANEEVGYRLEKNAIERRLLLQIYAKFGRNELPASEYKLLPGKLKFRAFLTCLFAVAILFVLLLTFRDSLAQLLVFWNPKGIWMQGARNWIIDNRHILQLILYGYVFIIIFLEAIFFIYRVIPKIKMSKVSLTSTTAQLEMEKNACTDYLDQYTMELIYCLVQISSKIDRTIVFEDMDRLNPEICIEIFTRLRELNHLVNLRLPKKQYIRFIFVTNDDIANLLSSTKFFDYILPIMSGLNEKSSAFVFMQNLKAVNQSLRKEFSRACNRDRLFWKAKEYIRTSLLTLPLANFKFVQKLRIPSEQPINYQTNCFDLVEAETNHGIIYTASPYIADYRLQFAILNDYGLLMRLYQKNNCKELDGTDIEGILAFAIYKYLWTNDYQQINKSGENFFTGKSVESIAESDTVKLLRYLKDNGKLSIRSLLYSGFSEEKIAERFKEILELGSKCDAIDAIRNIKAEDIRCIDVLTDYCTHYAGDADNRFISILAETVKCVERCKFKGKDAEKWFFSGHSVKVCLDALICLDDDVCINFIQSLNWTVPSSVFATCSDWSSVPLYSRYWTHKRLRAFSIGVKQLYRNSQITIYDEEYNTELSNSTLEDELKKYR